MKELFQEKRSAGLSPGVHNNNVWTKKWPSGLAMWRSVGTMTSEVYVEW